jgi:hypothetical protein
MRSNGHPSYKVPGQLRTCYWKVTLSEIDDRMHQFSAWTLTVLRLSQRWSWSFQSLATRIRVLGRVVTEVAKGSFYLHLLVWVWNPTTERTQLPVSTPSTSKVLRSFTRKQVIKVQMDIHLERAVKFKNDSWSSKCSPTWMLNSRARLFSQTERLQYLHSSAEHPWQHSYCFFLQKASLSRPHMPIMCLIRASAYGFIIYKCRSICRYE